MQGCYGGVAQAYNNRIENCLRLGLGGVRLREALTPIALIQETSMGVTKYPLNLTRTYL